MEYQSSLSQMQMQLLQLYELFEQSHNNLNHLRKQYMKDLKEELVWFSSK
jgi:hypothetical protein